MIKYIKISSLIIVSVIFISSCIKYKFNNPDEAVYNPDIEATTTIDELKNLYEGGLTLLDTNVVISGTVIANDKSGNLYKAIIIQDSTAGIEISLNAYELHNNYHIGDFIFVKCQDLYLGEYGEVLGLITMKDVLRLFLVKLAEQWKGWNIIEKKMTIVISFPVICVLPIFII